MFTGRDFIRFVEGKLEEHGVEKVIPDDKTLAIAWKRAHGHPANLDRVIKSTWDGYDGPPVTYDDSDVPPAPDDLADLIRASGPSSSAPRTSRGTTCARPSSRRATRERQPAARPLPRVALTRAEAAAAIGVSLDTFERYVQPDLRLVRLGRTRLVPVEELREWARRNAERTVC